MVLALPKKRGEKNGHGIGPGLHGLGGGSKVADVGRAGEDDMANGHRVPRRLDSSLSTWTLHPKSTKSHVMPDEHQRGGTSAGVGPTWRGGRDVPQGLGREADRWQGTGVGAIN